MDGSWGRVLKYDMILRSRDDHANGLINMISGLWGGVMVNKREKQNNPISRSLVVTFIAGIIFLILFVYGMAGFLLLQYFKENPGQRPQQVADQSMAVQPFEIVSEEMEKTPANGNGTISPQLVQPASENTNTYTRVESPLVKSLEQIASLKQSVVMIETGDHQGSGVVISDQGHVVTNFHVIEASPYMTRATLETPTGEMINRELMLLGYDLNKDLALLQFKNRKDLLLQPLPMGSIESVSEGQRIVTIGCPQGLLNTVSDGIVSGIRRFDSEIYIQISAPISPGNSGGALVNMKGELIGLTTFKISESENLNIAISADDLTLLIDSNPRWVKP